MRITVGSKPITKNVKRKQYLFHKNIYFYIHNYIILANEGSYMVCLRIWRLSWLAGGSSVAQLVADHSALSHTKLRVITDVSPSRDVYLYSSRGVKAWGDSVASETHCSSRLRFNVWQRRQQHKGNDEEEISHDGSFNIPVKGSQRYGKPVSPIITINTRFINNIIRKFSDSY